MANIPLVRQQADAIRRDCGATVAEISSAGHHGKLPTAVWRRMADEFQVVVVTAQILLDALRQGYWNMTRVKKKKGLCLGCCMLQEDWFSS